MANNILYEYTMVCVKLLTALLLNPSEELKQKLLDASRCIISLDAADLEDELDLKDLLLAEHSWVNQVAMQNNHPERVRTWNILASIDEYLDQLRSIPLGEISFNDLENLLDNMMTNDIYVSIYADDYSAVTGLRPAST